MLRTITVVDNLLPDPHAVREAALLQEFGPREYAGHVYQGIATGFDLPAAMLVARALGVPQESIRPAVQFWRLGLDGDDTTTFIHADGIAAAWAVVLYLSEPGAPLAGTAFWRNRRLGTDALAPDLPAEEYDRINAEGHDEGAWEMTSLIGQRMGRMVIYPTCLFHSRHPRRAWGTTAAEGRLVWVTFFDLVEASS